MHTDCLSADRDPLPDVDDASDDSNAAHNVHAAEVNVDAFWQNPYALSMVSSNTVALRDVKVPVGADSRTPADQLKSDRQRNVASPSPSPELPSATPTRKRKYGSHLCPVCGRSFGQKMVMYEHLNLHYGVRPHFCAVCGIRFASCSNLIKHRQLHRKQFACVLCGDQSPNLNSFGDVQNHVLSVHPDEFAYRCTVCHSKFETQGLLADHVIMHPPMVLETRLEGKDKRKRNKPLVQLSNSKRSGPNLRNRLRNSALPSRNATASTSGSIGKQTAKSSSASTKSSKPAVAKVSAITNGEHEPPKRTSSIAEKLEAAKAAEDDPAARSTTEDERLFETLVQRRVANGDLFRCTICNILFFDRAMYSVHKCTHEENNPLRCAMCRTQCSDRYEFALHCVKPKQPDTKE